MALWKDTLQIWQHGNRCHSWKLVNTCTCTIAYTYMYMYNRIYVHVHVSLEYDIHVLVLCWPGGICCWWLIFVCVHNTQLPHPCAPINIHSMIACLGHFQALPMSPSPVHINKSHIPPILFPLKEQLLTPPCRQGENLDVNVVLEREMINP